ncbi:MAG: 50S ribosomal protein L6, partial [Armatimonadetes bacterium]|nr:50S ribosomal protein L6 [Armatimonadota bacterium]
VTVGYEKVLQIIGVGYKAVKIEKGIQLNLGFSHPVIIEPPIGINLEVEGNNKIIIRGIDKQLVGQVAANIRAIRLPEVYKGKGIRYEGEIVPKKAGKAGKTAAAK